MLSFLPHSLPVKGKGMATGDVYENEMRIVDAVDYLRGLAGKDSALIVPSDLLVYFGIARVNRKLVAGEEMVIYNRSGGLAIIKVSSNSNTVGMAVINSDLTANVLSEFPSGNFGSKKEGKVCLYRKENNGNLYLYNGTGIDHNINACVISVD